MLISQIFIFIYFNNIRSHFSLDIFFPMFEAKYKMDDDSKEKKFDFTKMSPQYFNMEIVKDILDSYENGTHMINKQSIFCSENETQFLQVEEIYETYKENILGKGSDGVIIEWKNFAIKKQTLKKQNLNSFIGQILILKQNINFPFLMNICRDCCYLKQEEDNFIAYIIMEKKMNNLHSMSEDINFNWKISRLWKVDMMIRMTRAVFILHEQGILHRDIKLSNFLMENEFYPQLTDFAHSVSENDDLKLFESIGTEKHRAPELKTGKSDAYSKQSDIFALGKAFYLLTTHDSLQKKFSTDETKFNLNSDSFLQNKTEHDSEYHFGSLINKMTEKIPEDRYSLSIVLDKLFQIKKDIIDQIIKEEEDEKHLHEFLQSQSTLDTELILNMKYDEELSVSSQNITKEDLKRDKKNYQEYFLEQLECFIKNSNLQSFKDFLMIEKQFINAYGKQYKQIEEFIHQTIDDFNSVFYEKFYMKFVGGMKPYSFQSNLNMSELIEEEYLKLHQMTRAKKNVFKIQQINQKHFENYMMNQLVEIINQNKVILNDQIFIQLTIIYFIFLFIMDQNTFDQIQEQLIQAKKYELQKDIDETKPFDHLYEQRKILQQLSLKQLPLEVENLIKILLGKNYFDTEENSHAIKNLTEAYDYFINEDVPKSLMIQLCNLLGFLKINYDEIEVGLDILNKGEKIFTQDEQKQESQVYQLSEIFFPLKQVEDYNLKTHFYLAQAYAKVGDKHQAAFYCASTLQSQIKKIRKNETPEEWDTNDFGNNCIGLSQYYSSEHKFKESVLILIQGKEIIESLQPTERDILGHLDFMLGNVYKSFFEYNANLIINKQSSKDIQQQINEVELKVFESIKFQDFVISQDYDGLKEYFKKALQNYKKAQEILVLDGYVTEYIEIQKSIISLYKLTYPFETSSARITAIESRIELMIESVRNQLNQKYFKKQYIELLAELGELKSRQFERYQQQFTNQNKKLSLMQEKGDQGLQIWNEVIQYFEEEKDTLNQSFLNCLYNKGRILTKNFVNDKNRMRENLIEALNIYKKIRDVILAIKQEQQVIDSSYEEQLKVTEEFIELLPVRIRNIVQ